MIATWVWVKIKPPGIGPQVLNHQRTTGFSPWFLLPGQPILGTHFLTHSHLCVLSYSGCYSSWPTTSFEQPAVPKWTQDSTGELRELDFRPRKDIETRRSGVVGSRGYPHFCDTSKSPHLFGAFVFGKPFLLYQSSGHFSQS